MTAPDPQTFTRLLGQVRDGDERAVESLLAVVYEELRNLAGTVFSRERSDHTLQPTAVIHEAWLKLTGNLGHIEDRRHFFVLASRAMRQVLADYARGHRAQKRGEGQARVSLDGVQPVARAEGLDLVEFDDLLTGLSNLNARHAQVVELRVLGGLATSEVAETLGVPEPTVEADWFTAKSWLRTRLGRAR